MNLERENVQAFTFMDENGVNKGTDAHKIAHYTQLTQRESQYRRA